MIYLLVTQRGAHTLHAYLQDWAGREAQKLSVLLYDDFPQYPALSCGTYVFTDLERLTNAQLALICDFAERLTAHFPSVRIINHPQHALRRFDLLEALHAAGINKFRAYPAVHIPENINFPVFIRFAREHTGPCSQLILDRPALLRALMRLAATGIRLDELLAVEFCGTCHADGWFRKYAAFCFGGRIIPARVTFSNFWVVKSGFTKLSNLNEEQDRYIQTNPHEDWIRKVFDLANIQYGRIDYSMLGDKPQVWEINCNPTLLMPRAYYEKEAPEEIPNREELARTLGDCFMSLDTAASDSPQLPLQEISLDRFKKLLNW
jgi:hypothetical protein